MSRIAEGEAETACPLTCEPPSPDPGSPQRDQVGRLSRQGFSWLQIGTIGIAVGEVAKGREQVVRALMPDSADDISTFASDGSLSKICIRSNRSSEVMSAFGMVGWTTVGEK